MRTTKTKTLVECALMIALAFILGYIPIFELPQGGSITACSMMPLVVASFRHGPKWGLLTGFIFSLIQKEFGNPGIKAASHHLAQESEDISKAFLHDSRT